MLLFKPYMNITWLDQEAPAVGGEERAMLVFYSNMNKRESTSAFMEIATNLWHQVTDTHHPMQCGQLLKIILC